MSQKVLEILGELSRRQPSQVFELPLLVRRLGNVDDKRIHMTEEAWERVRYWLMQF